MNNEIVYREITNFGEYSALEDIQQDAWNMPDRELVPKRLINATRKSGGVIIGAYDSNQIIGYVWGWVGNKEPYGVYIYSHHNAVRKVYQNSGIGYQLKLEQRKWAIEKGYEYINWTFDPLQSKNAYLNFHKLGATSNLYNVNYWGDMHDDLNVGMETDRFYCNWILKSQHTMNHLKDLYHKYTLTDIKKGENITETKMKNGFLGITNLDLHLSSPKLFLEISPNFNEMQSNNKELAIDWRDQTRKAFKKYFSKGYTVTDFIVIRLKEQVRCFHLLENSN